MPRGQRNDRSAWTLLALGDLTPARPWAKIANPIMDITPIIEWIATHCGKVIAYPGAQGTSPRSASWTAASTVAPRVFAVLTTERNAA